MNELNGSSSLINHCSPDATSFLSQCSVPCGVGQRTRDVKCVSNLGDVVDDEECNMKLRPNDIENCDMGPCAKSWFLTEWSDRVRLLSIFVLPSLLKQEHQNCKNTHLYSHKRSNLIFHVYSWSFKQAKANKKIMIPRASWVCVKMQECIERASLWVHGQMSRLRIGSESELSKILSVLRFIILLA